MILKLIFHSLLVIELLNIFEHSNFENMTGILLIFQCEYDSVCVCVHRCVSVRTCVYAPTLKEPKETMISWSI